MKRVRTVLGIAFAMILGSLILAVGVFLLHTEPGKRNQLPGGLVWSIIGALMIFGAIAKSWLVMRPEK